MLKYDASYPPGTYAPFKDSDIIGKPVSVMQTSEQIGVIVGITRKDDVEIIHMELEDTDIARQTAETVGWVQTPTAVSSEQERMDV